jgi:hypothetical protein
MSGRRRANIRTVGGESPEALDHQLGPGGFVVAIL